METQNYIYEPERATIDLPEEVAIKEDSDRRDVFARYPSETTKPMKTGFTNNIVKKLDKKRRFTTRLFSTNVNNNYDTPRSLNNSGPMPRTVSEPVYEDEQRADPPPSSSRKSKIAQKLSNASAALPSLPLSKNISAIKLKDKLSPTSMKQFTDVKADMKKMKGYFHGSRKSTLPTYVAANLRRGSDVKDLVQDDDFFSDSENNLGEVEVTTDAVYVTQ